MDTSETYVKMCEKAEEIQNVWHVPNGAYSPDIGFTYKSFIYKRTIIERGLFKKETVSHFTKYDYAKENPEWLSAMGGRLGIIQARHGSAGGLENVSKYGGGFVEIDSSFPAKEIVVEIRGGMRTSDEQWLPKEDIIWLPRQDQLQEMLGDFLNSLHRFAEWAIGGWVWGNSYLQVFNSMEQLLLAFVMEEKYQKTWNGAEWQLK